MVWGGITVGGRTNLVFVDGTLTAQRYRNDILIPQVVPYVTARNLTFQQDNARPHVAHANMNFLRQQNVNVLPWPAMSPDLSPIEHMWDFLDRQIRKRAQQPQNLQELRNALQQEWRNIPVHFVNKLMASVRR